MENYLENSLLNELSAICWYTMVGQAQLNHRAYQIKLLAAELFRVNFLSTKAKNNLYKDFPIEENFMVKMENSPQVARYSPQNVKNNSSSCFKPSFAAIRELFMDQLQLIGLS